MPREHPDFVAEIRDPVYRDGTFACRLVISARTPLRVCEDLLESYLRIGTWFFFKEHDHVYHYDFAGRAPNISFNPCFWETARSLKAGVKLEIPVALNPVTDSTPSVPYQFEELGTSRSVMRLPDGHYEVCCWLSVPYFRESNGPDGPYLDAGWVAESQTLLVVVPEE